MSKNVKFILVYLLVTLFTINCCNISKRYFQKKLNDRHTFEINYQNVNEFAMKTYSYSYNIYNVNSFSLKLVNGDNKEYNLGTYYLNNNDKNYRNQFDYYDKGIFEISIDEQENGLYINYSSDVNKSYSQTSNVNNIFTDYLKKGYESVPLAKKINSTSYLIMNVVINKTNYSIYASVE